MQKVPITLVKPGMILAKPVTNEKGMPLCAEGTELSANLINRLKKMNVPSLTLEGHPVDLGDAEKTPREKLQDIAARFSRVDGDPIMDKLRDAITSAIAPEGIEDNADERLYEHQENTDE